MGLSMRLRALTFLTALCIATPAMAAEITAYQSLRGVNINIIGQIYPGDEQKFARFNYPSGSTLVYLSSLGGDVETAIKIGRMIWDRGYITLVNNNGPCASACTLIWFGGKISTIQRDSFHGFHCPFIPGTHQCSDDGAQYMITYLKSVGLTDKQAWILTHIASPDDVAIATEAWARRLEFKFVYIPSLFGARSCAARFCVLLG
jgi:hypothetical protein